MFLSIITEARTCLVACLHRIEYILLLLLLDKSYFESKYISQVHISKCNIPNSIKDYQLIP